jgi:O-acetyl-ADP-ribose deacetylase (regulator of RNase III)
MEIILCDLDTTLTEAWRRAFRGYDVEVESGDLLDLEVDAYVSPANSYGYMDGGLDLLLRNRFPGIQQRVQTASGGFLKIGSAVVVETVDAYVPYLVSAPPW